MRKLSVPVLGSALIALVACGGKVVFDGVPAGQGGAGGTSSAAPTSQVSTTTTTGTTGGAPQYTCMNPPPPGTIIACSGSAVSGGNNISCITDFCDTNQTTYEADCKATTCVCRANGITLCTCALNGPGDICAGTAPPCCPFHS